MPRLEQVVRAKEAEKAHAASSHTRLPWNDPKSCGVLCCFNTGTVHAYVILPASGWPRARLLILSLSPHKPFMSPSPFNRRLLYVLPEVSPRLLPFCWHLYQILLICMWCLDWHAPHLASVKDSANVPALQVQKGRSYGHLKCPCGGCGEEGSWQLVADKVGKGEPSLADFILQYLWCGVNSASGGLCSTYGWLFVLFHCTWLLGQNKSVAAVR